MEILKDKLYKVYCDMTKEQLMEYRKYNTDISPSKLVRDEYFTAYYILGKDLALFLKFLENLQIEYRIELIVPTNQTIKE